jgi:hypothetical protein
MYVTGESPSDTWGFKSPGTQALDLISACGARECLCATVPDSTPSNAVTISGSRVVVTITPGTAQLDQLG